MPNKPLPDFVAPMQASPIKEPFDSLDWIFETKLDGYRAIAVIDSTGKTRIWSRNHLPLEPKFPTVGDAVTSHVNAHHHRHIHIPCFSFPDIIFCICSCIALRCWTSLFKTVTTASSFLSADALFISATSLSSSAS
jgi:hypothetical protein